MSSYSDADQATRDHIDQAESLLSRPSLAGPAQDRAVAQAQVHATLAVAWAQLAYNALFGRLRA